MEIDNFAIYNRIKSAFDLKDQNAVCDFLKVDIDTLKKLVVSDDIKLFEKVMPNLYDGCRLSPFLLMGAGFSKTECCNVIEKRKAAIRKMERLFCYWEFVRAVSINQDLF